MAAKVKQLADGTILYRCPCGDTHAINDKTWTFDGNTEAPTFAPSVLVTTGHLSHAGGSAECWCTYAKEHPGEKVFTCYLCHSFVRGGVVEFLGDCTHALAGQKVPIGDWRD